MRVGITGHQELGLPEEVAWIRSTLGRLLREHHATGGISSLAQGADQLFAEVLEEIGLPLLAIIPCAGYEKAFRSAEARKAFARLRDAASERIQLPYPAPSEEAFFAAGREIVERCDLLFAVWDGAPARGRGGTADIVAFAKDRARKTIQLHPPSHSVRPLGTVPG